MVASLGHVAVGMLAGRAWAPGTVRKGAAAMAVFSGLALLPDLDYVGVMMGVVDDGPCGHRGATHSLVLPILAAVVGGALAGRMGWPRWKLAVLAGLVVASHAVLDAMTVTSRGVPLLWPFCFYRFEMPWRPIPNAPCGLEFLSREGLRVATIELLQFLPLILLALKPNKRAPLLGLAGPTDEFEARRKRERGAAMSQRAVRT